jgi:2-polyprenyl-3-methyl-5-hydroxy-6-metoxy-1,4-benzoquinol methylase
MTLASIYRSIYRDPDHATYGSGLTRYAEILDHLRADSTWRSVLDLGCGRGDFVHALGHLGINAVGYDPFVPFDADEIGWRFLNDLPPKVIPFDLVTCVDVLEHMPDETAAAAMIDVAFAHARRRVALAISDMSDPHPVPGHGVVELHTLRRDCAWWTATIARHAAAAGFLPPVPHRINPDRFLISSDRQP